ncbi:hypothetical protein ABFP60_17950 [Clostridioides difficile]
MVVNNIDKYYNIISIVCKYYGIDNEELEQLIKKKDNVYLTILLMKNFKCLREEKVKENLGIINNRALSYRLKKAEEKILINKDFRDEYFELEEKIKENFKNA